MKCIWLTGLPCSGKTTIANELVRYYPNAIVLDGDDIRKGALGQDVGFSREDREKHLLRMAHVARLLMKAGVTTICAFVSPSREVREEIRDSFYDGQFIEVFVSASVEVCEKRDVKGMYARARRGEIQNFTGVNADYENPYYPELTLLTTDASVQSCVKSILDLCPPYDERRALFIGRWNGIFHNGHDAIIQSKLIQGTKVLMAIRNVPPDEKNAWTAVEVKDMLEYRWKDYGDRVKVIIIPDISSVEYGRDVGYEVNEVRVDYTVAGISGTKCREMIKNGDPAWKDLVPKELIRYLETKYS